MTSLAEAFSGEDHQERLLLPVGGALTGRAIWQWLRSRKLAAWQRQCAGATVALCLSESEDLAMCLLALDGVAARIVLLPTEMAAEELLALAQRASPTHWIGSAPDVAEDGFHVVSMPPRPDAADEQGDAREPALATEWVLATSGTTKTPKLVVHTLATLAKSVRRNPEVGRTLCWGLLYDLNRFAGIQVFLQAIFGGSRLVVLRKGLALEDSLAALAHAGCNALSATPTMWRRILMTPGAERLELRQITLGGEIADASVLKALHAAFPVARIVHIYASTEAGVGFAVADGREGFPLEFLERGVPGAELRVNAEGVLQIRPAVTGQRYLHESGGLTEDDGFVTTGDRVSIVGDRVYFLGRDSGAINVGGNKVQPEEVERTLLEHPAVAFASVGAKRSGIMGALVEARIVLRPGTLDGAGAPAAMRAWCSERLERFKVPAIIRVVDAIEVSDNGKVTRRAE
jgi:acyl-CoA synthetase (AMP-forming)/AMP-acid ligase II